MRVEGADGALVLQGHACQCGAPEVLPRLLHNLLRHDVAAAADRLRRAEVGVGEPRQLRLEELAVEELAREAESVHQLVDSREHGVGVRRRILRRVDRAELRRREVDLPHRRPVATVRARQLAGRSERLRLVHRGDCRGENDHVDVRKADAAVACGDRRPVRPCAAAAVRGGAAALVRRQHLHVLRLRVHLQRVGKPPHCVRKHESDVRLLLRRQDIVLRAAEGLTPHPHACHHLPHRRAVAAAAATLMLAHERRVDADVLPLPREGLRPASACRRRALGFDRHVPLRLGIRSARRHAGQTDQGGQDGGCLRPGGWPARCLRRGRRHHTGAMPMKYRYCSFY
eukprot:Rhum_TRINITY_DN10745_c0_g1::Rhum_TRINITY_DN10745_c0_g1_i1::g.40052::m.40052